jgi:dTDP-4-amino-4,6-dideoxygalactose transaminase
LAGIGRGQLIVLEDRVKARRKNFKTYKEALGDLPGIEFMPEASFGKSTHWLTCLTINPEKFGKTREEVRLFLLEKKIESRPVWKPLHLQPIFAACESINGNIAKELFNTGLCLPSGSNLTKEDLDRVIQSIKQCYQDDIIL